MAHRYSRARMVCSCGRNYSRDGFKNHRHANPNHYEVNRYTFEKTPNSTRGKIGEAGF